MSKKDKKFVGLYKHLITGKQIEHKVIASDILEAAGQFDLITYTDHECILISLVRMKEKKPIKKKPAKTVQVITGSFMDIMKASVKHSTDKAKKKP